MGIFLRTLLLGIVSGSIYALASTGLVLTFRTSGVLNFGYGALAMFTTFVHWQFTVQWGWPVVVSALVVLLVVAPLIGLFLDTQLFSRIQGQPMVISIIATVGLTVLLQGLVNVIWGAESRPVPSLFPQGTVGLPGGANIGTDQIAILIVAAGSAGLLATLLKFTRIGVSFRAVVDNRPIAGLMAVNTGLVSGLAWAIGTSFAALTGILLAPQLFLDPLRLPLLIIATVFGAAIIGYLRNLPLAWAGGILLGVIQSLLIQYGHFQGVLRNLRFAVPFIIVILAVLLAPKALRLAGLGASFVVRTREQLEEAPQGARLLVSALVFCGLALVPVLASGSPSWLVAMTTGMITAIVFLSIVILTGYSGQISLGHTAFMGVSAYTAGHLAADLGVPIWIAFVLGALASVPIGALIGVIAVRLQGLFLALMTLGLAFVAQEMFFNDNAVSGGLSGFPLPRPHEIKGDSAFYYFVLAVFIGCAALAINLRNGRTGRVLAAMRDSETGSRALGVNVFKYKVYIFAISASMAGVGAILGAWRTQTIGQNDFIPFLSLFLVTLAVVGGIFHVGGAIASGLLFGLYPQLFGDIRILAELQLIFFGLGATLALAKNPEGLFGELRRGGSAVLRMIGRRGAPGSAPAPAPIGGGQE